MLAASVALIFAWALLVPLLWRIGGRAGGVLSALLPAVLFVGYAVTLAGLPADADGAVVESISWVPSLGVDLSLRLDGLSAVYALLILGIGALVVLFAAPYELPARRAGAFDSLLFVFMGAMLGVVVADDVIVLFVFWEITSISSYLLIGFKSEKPAAQKGARQALLVTSGGSLGLLAGLLWLSEIAGTRRLSELALVSDALLESPAYVPVLLLIVFGALTKSAIAPFHFWLSDAMTAPTPVSAYLHSATLVKAGVYLLARLRPALGASDTWFLLLAIAGAATISIGCVRLIAQRDAKRVLAESTVIGLGALTMLLGIPQTYAIRAFAVFLVVHALYKAALFMIVGAVEQVTGTRDLDALNGLGRRMRVTATIAVLAGVAMMGMPPMFGFIGKELVYHATLEATRLPLIWTLAAIAGNAFSVCAALLVVHGIFFGAPSAAAARAHEPRPAMLVGPMLLSLLGLFFGVFHGWAERAIVVPKVEAIKGAPVRLELALWGGLTWPLALSVITLAAGILVYRFRAGLRAGGRALVPAPPSAKRAFEALLVGLGRLATWQTRKLQNGRLRQYVLISIACAVVALVLPLGVRFPHGGLTGLGAIGAGAWFAAAISVLAVGVALAPGSRLRAALAVAVAGMGVGVLFALLGAPDVALAQFAAEALLLLILMLASARLAAAQVQRRSVIRDASIAIAAGAAVSWALVRASALPYRGELATYYIEHAYDQAHGRNVVNTILTDFRALDTLGEIAVLVAALLASWALVAKRRGKPCRR
jgi:multicomponent Na+:H+ antiporter subunit A